MLDEARRQANPLGLRVAERADFCFAECAGADCALKAQIRQTQAAGEVQVLAKPEDQHRPAKQNHSKPPLIRAAFSFLLEVGSPTLAPPAGAFFILEPPWDLKQ